jgi:hypothetical protein
VFKANLGSISDIACRVLKMKVVGTSNERKIWKTLRIVFALIKLSTSERVIKTYLLLK